MTPTQNKTAARGKMLTIVDKLNSTIEDN